MFRQIMLDNGMLNVPFLYYKKTMKMFAINKSLRKTVDLFLLNYRI